MQSSSTKGPRARKRSSSCWAEGRSENNDTVQNIRTARPCWSACRLLTANPAGIDIQAESAEQVLLARPRSGHPLVLALVYHALSLPPAADPELSACAKGQ